MLKKIISFAVATSLLGFALPALAATGSTVCVATAVNAREAAIGSAVSTFTQALSAAYSARASALQTAYGKGLGNGTLRTDIKAAWSAFNSAAKSARSAWSTSRKTAWSQFRTAAKACKSPSVPTDSANSSSEVSGQ